MSLLHQPVTRQTFPSLRGIYIDRATFYVIDIEVHYSQLHSMIGMCTIIIQETKMASRKVQFHPPPPTSFTDTPSLPPHDEGTPQGKLHLCSKLALVS